MTERKQSHWITDIVDPETRSWEEGVDYVGAVLAGVVVLGAGAAVLDLARCVGKTVPDAFALTVFLAGALDLVCR